MGFELFVMIHWHYYSSTMSFQTSVIATISRRVAIDFLLARVLVPVQNLLICVFDCVCDETLAFFSSCHTK